MFYKFLRFPQGKPKAVTLSYDDGHPDDLKLLDIINRYNLKCTFNLNNDKCNKIWGNSCLSGEELEKYYLSHGHEIAIHGAMHSAPGMISVADGIKNILECRTELEKKTGRIIKGMAYPDSGITNLSPGITYDKIKNYLTELGISYARTLGGDNNLFRLPTDWHAWMPTAHHVNPKLSEYIDEFLNIDYFPQTYVAQMYPRLFYLWGHSFEFSEANNWDYLESICKKLSGKDDIWYATNIEIYNYVQAYNSLVYSADGATVYNPTLCDIWMSVDKNTIMIKSGETVRLEQ